MDKERIVRVGLLTQRDVHLLGPTFHYLWPIDETPCFGTLIAEIDHADREMWRREQFLRRGVSCERP